MSRKALLIGIDAYQNFSTLGACVSDARSMHDKLEKNYDRSPNYHCELLLGEVGGPPVTKRLMLERCRALFQDFDGKVLLYFAGHGSVTDYAGFFCTSDATVDFQGILMDEVLAIARRSSVSDTLIIADCCHAGDLGNLPQSFTEQAMMHLSENMTIIAGARRSERTLETNSNGLFTAAVVDALDGSAADHRGFVTAPAIYAAVESRFSAWSQRPVFKSHATRVPIVRRCAPLITSSDLARLPELFRAPDFKYELDPEHEPEDHEGNVREPVNDEKVAIAQLFKRYRDAGLLKPTLNGEQLFWTARRRHTVELTPRGKNNWYLVKSGLA